MCPWQTKVIPKYLNSTQLSCKMFSDTEWSSRASAEGWVNIGRKEKQTVSVDTKETVPTTASGGDGSCVLRSNSISLLQASGGQTMA